MLCCGLSRKLFVYLQVQSVMESNELCFVNIIAPLFSARMNFNESYKMTIINHHGKRYNKQE